MNCNDEDNHQMHICMLKKKGLKEYVNKYSSEPTVQCRQCGSKANSSKYLCAAHLLDTAPSVEGGHGVVDIDEIGKSHEGSAIKNDSESKIATKQISADAICGGY